MLRCDNTLHKMEFKQNRSFVTSLKL